MMVKERWLKLMQSMGLPSSENCFELLKIAYSEHHRHYHTAHHIHAMLRHFDLTSNLTKWPNEVELAIWFHDAVYKPFSSENEKASAEWAKDFLVNNNYDGSSIERVYQLIMATKHAGMVKSIDEQLIVDVDLTILGTANHIYDEFELNVRKEYKFVPFFIYRRKRKQLLENFLAQDSVYHLEYFQNKYEETARSNLKRTISLL